MDKNHPEIIEYGYHHRAIFHSKEILELTAVGESINKTVPKTHKELPLLRQAYKVRLEEISVEKERESAEKAMKEFKA